MTAIEVRTLLEEHLLDAQVEVTDTKGNGRHFRVVVISPEFEGRQLIDQHRLVFDACNEYMKREIHALEIETHTPQEWQARTDS